MRQSPPSVAAPRKAGRPARSGTRDLFVLSAMAVVVLALGLGLHLQLQIAGQTALHHIPTSEEISRAVLFFASDLSRVVTGQTLDVNAGRVFN